MRSEVRRHGAAAIIGRSLSLTTNVAMTLVLAQTLEPRSFGEFAVFRTTVTFLGLVISCGLGTVALRLLSGLGKNTEFAWVQAREICYRITVLAAMASTFLCVAIFLASPFAAPFLFKLSGTMMLALAVVIASLGIGWLQIITDAARGLNQPGLAAWYGGVRGTPLASVFLLAVVLAEPEWTADDWLKVGLVYGAGLILSALLALFALVKILRYMQRQDSQLGESSVRSTDASLRSLSSMAFPLAVAGAMMYLTTGGDLFLTAWFPCETDRYSYIAARRWTLLVSMPLAALNITAGGLIAGASSSTQKQSLQSFLRAGTTAIGIPALVVSAIAFFAPTLSLHLLFGGGYEASASVLPILVIGQVFIVATGPCGLVLSLTGHERVTLWSAAIGFAALALIGPWTALNFGAAGLAWLVTSLAAAISVATWIQCWRLTGLNTLLEPALALKPNELLARLHLSRTST